MHLLKRPLSFRKKEVARLEVEIFAAHQRTQQTYGPERLQRDLLDNGVKVGVYWIRSLKHPLRISSG